MTRLLIDVGNSRLKWRVDAGPGQALLTPLEDYAGVIDRADDASGGSMVARLRARLLALSADLKIDRALYSSVAHGEIANQLERLVQDMFPSATITRVVSAATLGGVVNGYRDPKSLGVDRLLALCGARAHIAQGALLVASIGTATTIDYLDASNRFQGGLILPGPILMARSLNHGTAQLPMVRIEEGAQNFGLDTAKAIEAGIIHATAGAIERSLRAAQARGGTVTCVIGGGGGFLAVKALPFETHLFNNLVLDGLAALADQKTHLD